MLHSRARHPLHRAYKIRPGSQSRYKCDVGRNSRHVCLTPQGPTSRDVSVCAKRRHSERYFDCGIMPVTEFNP